MNLLISSVSRKVWLVQAFQRAVKKYSGKVYASDLDPLAVGLKFADQVLPLPRLNSPEFLEQCLALCQKNSIGLIIPTRDEELAWFARHSQRFNDSGIVVMVAPERVINLCQDKQAFLSFCQQHDFNIPHIYTSPTETSDYPLFARPRFGKGGVGAGPVDQTRATQIFAEEKDEWVVQDLIQADEYTLDLFADFSGTILSVVPRQRLRVQSGEVVVSKTADVPEIIEDAIKLATALGLVGHNTLQCFWDGETINWIEVNPRYGGGAALGFAAGADSPAMLLALLYKNDITQDIGNYKKGLSLFRYSTDLIVDESGAE